jgi:hypothetical protein
MQGAEKQESKNMSIQTFGKSAGGTLQTLGDNEEMRQIYEQG